MKTSLLGITRDELLGQLQEHGHPAYRVDQILDWVWKKRPESIEQMSNLPKNLRDFLQENYTLYPLTPARELGSTDTTRKMLYRLHDGRYIESVLIPANPALYGGRSDRLTLWPALREI
jgi:23S rRNA (adenine2503-C2)-methyltransferase